MRENFILFSERYAELIKAEKGKFVDNVCGQMTDDAKEDIAEVMRQFIEEKRVYPNRYSSECIYTNALESAIKRFNEIKDATYIWFEQSDFNRSWSNPLRTTFTPFLFDIIELQYAELSNGEKCDFQSEINAAFHQHDIPWLLCEGRMIKIDAVQFELDLRQKTLERMQEIKDCDSKFQAAYSELLEACDAFTSGKYSSAILNAERSFESVLKVICEIEEGSADRLTKTYLNTKAGTLPTTMKATGFQSNVMMALPYIRNNVSSGHGEGAIPVVIRKPLAKLAINLSAAMNTYLIEEYRDSLTAKQDKSSVNSLGSIDDELPF